MPMKNFTSSVTVQKRGHHNILYRLEYVEHVYNAEDLARSATQSKTVHHIKQSET